MKKRSKTVPYRLLVILLYGQQNWLARSGYTVTAPAGRLATKLGTRAGRLREYLYQLEDWGLVESIRINPNWVQVQLKCPVGMSWDLRSPDGLVDPLQEDVIDV